MENKITLFYILENRQNNMSEKIYIDNLYKYDKLEKYKYFNFYDSKKILFPSSLKININTIIYDIVDKIKRSIAQYDDEIVNVQILFFVDNDFEYGHLIESKMKFIENEIKKIQNVKWNKIVFLIPNKNSKFEEFLYYHINDIKRNFCKDITLSINKACVFFKIDDLKGKNVDTIFSKLFNNKPKCDKNFKKLEENLVKYNSIYKKMFIK